MKYVKPKITIINIENEMLLAGSDQAGACHCGCSSSCCTSSSQCKGNGIGGCNHKSAFSLEELEDYIY